jgi:hypothetical protein
MSARARVGEAAAGGCRRAETVRSFGVVDGSATVRYTAVVSPTVLLLHRPAQSHPRSMHRCHHVARRPRSAEDEGGRELAQDRPATAM